MVCRSGHKPLRHFYFPNSGSEHFLLRIRGQGTFPNNVQKHNERRGPGMPCCDSPGGGVARHVKLAAGTCLKKCSDPNLGENML
jgi:hypothetical protein